jgi:hydrogenase-4 component B
VSALLIVIGALACVVSGLLALFVRSADGPSAGSQAASPAGAGMAEPTHAAGPAAVQQAGGLRSGSLLAVILHVAGALTGLAGCALGLTGAESTLTLPWQVPLAAAIVRVDALSAFFAAPVFLLAAVGAIYAERYWPSTKERAAYVRCFYGVVTGALALVMVASHMLFFVALWEIVALACFLLVGTETADANARSASWLYLAASHVATLSLFGVVTLIHSVTGSWSFAVLPEAVATGEGGRALFWLAILAFGIKAGLMPLHVWLPGAHAAAPTHVSALMSGVVIKMGIYGLVRVMSLYPVLPDWMGGTILALGIVSSILGVAFALAQHDIKRLLAYHSIENIGIIVVGLGVGWTARAHGLETLAALAFAGGLLHVWNHALFKSLLFLGAGGAIHAVHTREIDRMGGLARRMPLVAAGFLTGAIAISGLPPLNGFVSEWLIYVAGFKAAAGELHAGWPWMLLLAVVPALALTGALALACFVKAFGAVFLGNPRTPEAAAAENAPASMRYAMLPLVLGCAAIGLAPLALAAPLRRIVAIAGGVEVALVPVLTPLQWFAPPLALLFAGAIALLLISVRRAPRVVTWDCGYASPTARMQYTSSSMARGLIGFFAWVMPPRVHAPHDLTLFPKSANLLTHVPDTVLDRGILPATVHLVSLARMARILQSGRIQLYILYVGAGLVALLVWSFR